MPLSLENEGQPTNRNQSVLKIYVGLFSDTSFLTLIRTYVDICQHPFFLFDCTRPLYASSAPFADEGRLIVSLLLQ